MATVLTDAEKYQQIEDLRTRADEAVAAKMETYFHTILEHSYRYSGAGSYLHQLQNIYANIERYGARPFTPNNEHSGLTFITRPKLCLTSSNLRQNRLMSMLDTIDPQSVQFMIRMLLDPKLASSPFYSSMVASSPLVQSDSPFLTPLMNTVESISGFPNQNLETFTTEGGFFSEDLTFAVGSDRCRKSFDLQLSFIDVQGGVIAAMIQFWLEYIACVTTGEMVAYAEDIDAQRINYTVSMYRFLLDPTKRFITRWCKCTGGFPISRPSGAAFDMNLSEVFVEAAKKFSVTFKFNHMGTDNDPIVLKEFNMLMERWCSDIKISETYAARELVPPTPFNNFTGLPYIVETEYGPELQFRARPSENLDTTVTDLNTTSAEIDAIQKNVEQQIAAIKNSISSSVGTLSSLNTTTTSEVNFG